MRSKVNIEKCKISMAIWKFFTIWNWCVIEKHAPLFSSITRWQCKRQLIMFIVASLKNLGTKKIKKNKCRVSYHSGNGIHITNL